MKVKTEFWLKTFILLYGISFFCIQVGISLANIGALLIGMGMGMWWNDYWRDRGLGKGRKRSWSKMIRK